MSKAQEYDQRFKELGAVLRALRQAEREYLDVEWLDTFLQEYVRTLDIPASIAHAAREWDL